MVIPKYNDSEDEFARIAAFIRDEVGVDTPWHVSAFYPTYRLKESVPTPAETLIEAREIGLAAGLAVRLHGEHPRHRRGAYLLLCLQKAGNHEVGVYGYRVRS